MFIHPNTLCRCSNCEWSGRHETMIAESLCPRCGTDDVIVYEGTRVDEDGDNWLSPDECVIISDKLLPSPPQKPSQIIHHALWKEGEDVLWTEDLHEILVDRGLGPDETGRIEKQSIDEANRIVKKLRDGV